MKFIKIMSLKNNDKPEQFNKIYYMNNVINNTMITRDISKKLVINIIPKADNYTSVVNYNIFSYKRLYKLFL